MVNTILKEADLFCPNSVRINFTIYHPLKKPKAALQFKQKILVIRFDFLQNI
ncbi:hypothetical protein LCAA2362_2802 [Lacticaseibacillus casei A2-362]|nr:hypothetical protein LCAA2362_2802 [Lacticaseibacillus casei A2-362]